MRSNKRDTIDELTTRVAELERQLADQQARHNDERTTADNRHHDNLLAANRLDRLIDWMRLEDHFPGLSVAFTLHLENGQMATVSIENREVFTIERHLDANKWTLHEVGPFPGSIHLLRHVDVVNTHVCESTLEERTGEPGFPSFYTIASQMLRFAQDYMWECGT